MKHIEIRQVKYDDSDFVKLCRELDEFLNIAIGGEDKREKYKKFNHPDTMDCVVIAYDKEKAVGCGALREYSGDEVEVKRVFVAEEYRGQNIGGLLLRYLITQAKKRGYQKMILETGEFLASSVRLYARYGFERISNYGQYKNMSESLCMGRSLREEDIIYCNNRYISPEEAKELFSSVGWLSAKYPERLAKALQKAGTCLTAWKGEELVGLVEVLDDGELNAYIHYLLVKPSCQHEGIGKALMERIKQKYKNYLHLVVISEKKETIPFYEKLNFTTEENATAMDLLSIPMV